MTSSLASVLLGVCRPYKSDFFNIFYCLLFAVVALTRSYLTYYYYVFPVHIGIWLSIVYSIPTVYLLFYTIHKFLLFCSPNYLETMNKLLAAVRKRFACYVAKRSRCTSGSAEDQEKDTTTNGLNDPDGYEDLLTHSRSDDVQTYGSM